MQFDHSGGKGKKRLTRRERMFEVAYQYAQFVHFLSPGPIIVPSHMTVILWLRQPNGGNPVQRPPVCVIRGDTFFSFLVRKEKKKGIDLDLRKFFPNAGQSFDLAQGCVSRLLSRMVTVRVGNQKRIIGWEPFEEKGKWPCFDTTPVSMYKFVRDILKKTTGVYEYSDPGKKGRLSRICNATVISAEGYVVSETAFAPDSNEIPKWNPEWNRRFISSISKFSTDDI